ncbi:MAG: HD domain-containing protein [Desulfovibrio sp.]|nr:HD domain-containing protein [Desulfovibrio sp.]
MKYYLVGGAVRDMLLGLTPRDFDYAFSGDETSFRKAHPDARAVGKTHGIYIVNGCEYARLVDDDPETDLRNRDFTVNALALDEEGHLFMHPSSLDDLASRVIRPCSREIFLKDPVRIFRLARFAAAWPDWSLSPELEDMLSEAPRELLWHIPPERVGNELRKAFLTADPSRFFTFLADHDLLSPWFRELDAARHITAGPPPWHNESVFEHTLAVLAPLGGDPLAAWMALCHDLGKTTTPEDMLPHHYGHEERGEILALELGKRLALPVRFITAGRLICREHMKAGRLKILRYGVRRDLLVRVHGLGLHDPFWNVVDNDSHTDLSGEAGREREILLSVRLPKEYWNLGKKSAEKLRMLQIEALRAQIVREVPEHAQQRNRLKHLQDADT